MVSKYLCDRLDWPLQVSEDNVKGKEVKDEMKKEIKKEMKNAAGGVECSAAPGPKEDEEESGAGRKRGMEGLVETADSASRNESSSSCSRGLPDAPASSSSAMEASSSSCAPASSPPDDFGLECCETSERVYRVSASRSGYPISRPSAIGVREGILGPFDANEVKVECTAKAEKGVKSQKTSHRTANDGNSSSRRGALPAPAPPPPPPSEASEEGKGDQRYRPRRSIPTGTVTAILSTSPSSSSRSSKSRKPNIQTEKSDGKRGRSAVRNTPISPAQQPAARRGGSAGRSTRACVSTTGTKISVIVAGRKSAPVGQRKVGRPPGRPRSPAIQIAPEVSHEIPVPEKRKRGRPKKV